MSEQPGPAADRATGAVSAASPGADLLPRWLRPARAWVHRQPAGVLIWKVTVSLVGAAIVLLGLALIPLPGPGWAIVFLGIAVWATEFAWAHRLLRYGQRLVREWTDWVRRQPLLVRGLIGLAGLTLLAGLGYLGWRYLF